MAMHIHKYTQYVRLCFLSWRYSRFKDSSNIDQYNDKLSCTSADSLAGSNHETEPSSHLALGLYERALELHPRVL